MSNPNVILYSTLGSIGRITGIANRHSPGLITEYMAYTRPLSTSEILQNYNAQKSRYGL
jgi:hypothetical protein